MPKVYPLGVCMCVCVRTYFHFCVLTLYFSYLLSSCLTPPWVAVSAESISDLSLMFSSSLVRG